ncbi:Aminodeoxychorismate lyase [Marinomonas spartinae]|uniref:aminodeoxychorismate lyase n=1 Tax=Marinomonas spartinae TaxID=1792290 RepID=UPI000808BED7|nr:aminodeoxychorismate lyase [Marinomonas spartinae]SBS38097.1 Aminodeoxychorismate lyase [Marinomonas spartinae]
MKWFVNYYQDDMVSASDRGLAYGDGVFETIKASPYGFYQLDDHFSRLTGGLKRLGMPFSEEDAQRLRQFLFDEILSETDDFSVVKIIVTRGEGGRGYLPPNSPKHTVLVGVGGAPDYTLEQRHGVRLGLSPIEVSRNRYLSGLKHLNRLENVLAKQHLLAQHFEDIMLDYLGNVVECIQSNIFCFHNGSLMTPSLAEAGVQGTYRKHIMASQSLYPVNICELSLNDLKQSDEIFITNSLMGVVPVISLQGCSFAIGENTLRLQQLMQTRDVHDVA